MLMLALVFGPVAWAADDTSGRDPATLSREFSDPLTTVPQVSLQEIYTPSNFGTDARTNRLLLRPIVPRLPRYSWFPFVQLIRPTFQILTVPTGPGDDTRTEFGDIQVFDFAVLPWPSRESGLTIGVGPTVNFPTATDDRASAGAWQLGPAFGTIYKGIPGILLGCLLQHPFSLEYTTSPHPPASSLFFQPIVLAYIGHGFYVKSADSTWGHSWDEGEPTTLPLSAGIGYIWLRDGSPPVNVSLSGEWMAYRDDAPVAAQTSVRVGITLAFPDWRPWL
jgi:hypothetical protein